MTQRGRTGAHGRALSAAAPRDRRSAGLVTHTGRLTALSRCVRVRTGIEAHGQLALHMAQTLGIDSGTLTLALPVPTGQPWNSILLP